MKKNIKFIEWSIKYKEIIEMLAKEEIEMISDLDEYLDTPEYIENTGLPSLNYIYHTIGFKDEIEYTLKYNNVLNKHKIFTSRKITNEELFGFFKRKGIKVKDE